MSISRRFRRIGNAVVGGCLIAGVSGCKDLFEVTDPGAIVDAGLNTPSAVPSIVAGISLALSTGLNGGPRNGVSNLLLLTAVISREFTFGSSFQPGHYNDGTVTPDEANSNTWNGMQRARWTAESGADRLKTILGTGYGTSAHAARANLLAGITNRFFGENYCQAVIDGGPAQDRVEYFKRAEARLTEAITIAQAANNTPYRLAAYGGRAAVRAWQGKWTEAMTDAAVVPTEFRYDALFNATAGPLNFVSEETRTVFNYSLAGTPWEGDSLDSRMPSHTVRNPNGTVALTRDAKTRMQQQDKFTSNSAPVALVRGTEMRLLEAENALRGNDIGGAFARINAARAFYGLAAIPAPAYLTTAWAIFRRERGATLWLEGRRLWDLSRWFAATGPAHDETLRGRAQCLPVGRVELDSNPNLR